MISNPPELKKPPRRFSQFDLESTVSEVDEKNLMQSFALRRRRMEAAARLTETMLTAATAMADSDNALPPLPTLQEDEGISATSAPCDMPRPGEGLHGDDQVTLQSPNALVMCTPKAAIEQETRRKVKKIHEMRIEQRRAAGRGIKPPFQLVESSMATTELPEKFTSTSLSFVLEALATSVSKIVDATDDIMLALSVLDKDETPPIFKPMGILSVQSRYSLYCYSIALKHLKQYEICETALLNGTTQEVSSMRERFLMHKEVLTAQEQKQKVLEEQLQSMRLRINTIDNCCRLWATSLLNVAPPPRMAIGTPSPIDALHSSLYDPHQNSPSLPPLRTSSVSKAADRAGSLRLSLVRRRSSARAETPLSTACQVSGESTPANSSLREFSGVDAMEVRVSQFWCNPYVAKAQQCAARQRIRRRRKLRAESMRADASQALGATLDLTPIPRHSISRPMSEVWQSNRDMPNRLSAPPESAGRGPLEMRLAVLVRGLLRTIAPFMNPADAHARGVLCASPAPSALDASASVAGCEEESAEASSAGGRQTPERLEMTALRSRGAESGNGSTMTPMAQSATSNKHNSSASRHTYETMGEMHTEELATVAESANNLLRYLGLQSTGFPTSNVFPNV